MERKKYLDYLRAISCIFIIMVHVAATNYTSISARSISWNIMNCYDCLAISFVPIFFMISGALMLSKDYPLTGKHLFQKAFRLFLIFYIWCFIYRLEEYVRNTDAIRISDFKEQIFFKALSGNGMYHLWFLPAVIVLYLVTPLLRQIVKDKKCCQYFIVIAFVCTNLIPTILKFSFPGAVVLQNSYNQFAIVCFKNYALYYVLGYYLDCYVDLKSRKEIVISSIAAIVCFAFQAGICCIDAYQKNQASTIMNDPFTVFMPGICICIFLLFKRYLSSCKSIYGFIRNFGKLSIGIYIIHPLILIVLSRFNIEPIIGPVILTIPLFAVCVALICYIICFIINKIPIIRKLLF